MKTPETLKKSMDARLKKINGLGFEIEGISGEMMDGGFNPKKMQELRDAVAELNQATHEYNAYRNTLETE